MAPTYIGSRYGHGMQRINRPQVGIHRRQVGIQVLILYGSWSPPPWSMLTMNFHTLHEAHAVHQAGLALVLVFMNLGQGVVEV
jgi:hypothetical protein